MREQKKKKGKKKKKKKSTIYVSTMYKTLSAFIISTVLYVENVRNIKVLNFGI